MTFYEELQLSSTGSKALIKNTTDPKEKRRHILIYNFKVYLVMAFCFVFVTLFSMLFGSDNSVAGVVFCWLFWCCARLTSASAPPMGLYVLLVFLPF